MSNRAATLAIKHKGELIRRLHELQLVAQMIRHELEANPGLDQHLEVPMMDLTALALASMSIFTSALTLMEVSDGQQ